MLAHATQPTAQDLGEIIGPVIAIFVLVAAILWMVVAGLGIGAGWLVSHLRQHL